jgi:hypothetical protein
VRIDSQFAVKTGKGWKHRMCNDLDEAATKYKGGITDERLLSLLGRYRANGGL